MAKISNSKAALSHAIAYLVEKQVDNGTSTTSQFVINLAKSTSIKELMSYAKEVHAGNDIEEFYSVMKKVVSQLKNPEHTDSECRGWYRVWESIAHNSNYFSVYDLGRDASMACTLLECGVITQQQFNQHKIKLTLNMAAASSYFWENGRPSAAKMVSYWAPGYAEKMMDAAILACIR